MIGVWNAVIKTPSVHLYTVFSLRETGGTLALTMETEPYDIGVSFHSIEKDGNSLLAIGIDSTGQTGHLELHFQDDTFWGTIMFSEIGTVAFTGHRGKGTSFRDRLQKYGEKSVEENSYWKGKWIWDQKQPEDNSNQEHRLVYFRRTFEVPADTVPSLRVDITADSRYRLYINGESVSVGPCKGDGTTHYYETIDISSYLVRGTNVLAAKVLHYPLLEPFKMGEGGPISIWRSESAGLLVEASLRDENGMELEALHSGPKWKNYRHQGYHQIPSRLIPWMGGSEHVDGAGSLQGWESPAYDDSKWHTSVVVSDTTERFGILTPWNLTSRPIPFMYEEKRFFVGVTKIDGIDSTEAQRLLNGADYPNNVIKIPANTRIVMELDAGELTTGYLTVGVRQGAGSIMKLLSSEGYEPIDSDWMGQRKKGNREDTNGKLVGEFDVYHVVGSANGEGREEIYEPFWFRTFRYVRVEIATDEQPLILSRLNYRETGYPLDVSAQFECSDEELNEVWDLSLRTLKRCMHETYEDCPYYEQLQYSMDSRLMMLYTYYVSADDRMPRRTIADFYRSRQPSGLLQSRYPSVQPQVIPSFALYWIDMLDEHYRFNGDMELIKTYRAALIELMDWYKDRLTEDGVVGVTSNRYWTYFDWVEEWPLGSPPESQEQPMLILSLMYAAALRKAAKLLSLTGWSQVADEMLETAEQVCESVKRLSWSEERQLFRDLPDLESYSQHMQIMAVLTGIIDGQDARSLLERALSEPIHRVTLPFSYLLMQSLKKVGLQARIFEQWDRWRVFASQGLTTLPETEVNPRSDCHAWSAVPLAEFPATILGVAPLEPGCKVIRIEPHTGGLQWAKGSVATSLGVVDVNWQTHRDEFQLHVRLPDKVTAQVRLPDGSMHTVRGEDQLECEVPNNQ